MALGERLVALGDVDVVAIKDVDGPVAVLVIFKMNSSRNGF